MRSLTLLYGVPYNVHLEFSRFRTIILHTIIFKNQGGQSGATDIS